MVVEGDSDISFTGMLLECFIAFPLPSRNKILAAHVVKPMIAALVELVNQHIDFSRGDKWLEQSALVLIPSARGKRVERVSQLYKHTIAHAAAETPCRVDAYTGWFE